ncbi:hypothetical protein DFH09DRAFT_275507 [Mycena vulgaris]|nr:hypothetical protein DFH09DRAFT_275507 [Mycena vulgaris]
MLYSQGFSAWVAIDGQEAPEYDVEISEDQKSVTCWIPSELGKTFSVHWTNAAYSHDTGGFISMDGNLCGGRMIIQGHVTLPITTHLAGITDGPGTNIRPFVFSSLELTDDDAFLPMSGASLHQELGAIQLSITPIRVAEAVPLARPSSLSEIKVHERAKKVVTQQITLGKSKPLAKPEVTRSWQRTGPDLVKFIFKYRPMDILQANGIVPLPPQITRTASPEPERAPTPDDDREEARILRARLNALEAKLVKKEKEKKPRVKRELADGAGTVIDLTQEPRSKRVKLEANRPFISGEVIDLT